VNYFTLSILEKRLTSTDAKVTALMDLKVVGIRKYTVTFNLKC